MKDYTVNIDMTWSQDYKVKASTAEEARKKAWDKFKANPPKKDFKINAEKE